MATKEISIRSEAQRLGQRRGNVIMKVHDGNPWRESRERSGDGLADLTEETDRLLSELTESYTAFSHTDNVAVQLVPLAEPQSEVVWQPSRVRTDVGEGYMEAGANNAADKRTAVDRAMLVAGPVLGFAGVELVTGSLIESGIAGIAGAGLAKAIGSVRGYARRRVFLNTLERNVHEIGREIHNGEQMRLPNKSHAQYVTPPQLEALKTQRIEIASAPGVAVPAYEVLRWISGKSFGGPNTVSMFSLAGYRHRLRTEGVVVELDSSLWKLFRRGYKEDPLAIFDDSGEKSVKHFIRSRDEVAQEAGLVLTPADPPRVALDLGAEVGEAWVDAKCSLISLPPGKLVRDLLIHSGNPNKLWQQIVPELTDMQEQYKQLYLLQKEQQKIEARAEAAGVSAEGDTDRLAELHQQAEDTKQYIFEVTLSVVGAAMLQDRQKRYSQAREALLASIGRTRQAEDQWSAMTLFDKGINAVVTQLDPDSEEAIAACNELVSYLSSTAQYIDGSQAVYGQVYAGMQKRLPQLQLP